MQALLALDQSLAHTLWELLVRCFCVHAFCCPWKFLLVVWLSWPCVAPLTKGQLASILGPWLCCVLAGLYPFLLLLPACRALGLGVVSSCKKSLNGMQPCGLVCFLAELQHQWNRLGCIASSPAFVVLRWCLL
jgi:hypothetical protein